MNLYNSLNEHKRPESFWRPNPEDITIEQSITFDFLFNLKFHHKYKNPEIIQLCREEVERLQEVINEVLLKTWREDEIEK